MLHFILINLKKECFSLSSFLYCPVEIVKRFNKFVIYYFQYDYLYKTISCLEHLTLSLPKQILIYLLLHKTTTYPTWPDTTSLVSYVKKNLSKTTTTKLYPGKKWETNIRQQGIIKISLSNYVYSIATL